MTLRPRRAGFALIVVLWLLVLLSSVALVGVRAGRLTVDIAVRRADVERATWTGRGCLAAARAAISSAVQRESGGQRVAASWRNVDVVIRESATAAPGRCTISAEPLGTRFDLNDADSTAIERLIRAADPAVDASALTAALLDWRDTDDTERRGGAERRWYLARGRAAPRNGAFRAREELRLVRGFESAEHILALFDVEPARISLERAPPELLSTIPGMNAAAMEYLGWRRRSGLVARDLDQIVYEAPRTLKPALIAAYATIAGRATLEPDGWLIRAEVSDAQGRPVATVEQLLFRLGAIVTPVRERSW